MECSFRVAAALVLLTVTIGGCDSETSRSATDQAASVATAITSAAASREGDANELTDQVKEAARDALSAVPTDGTLSGKTQRWIAAEGKKVLPPSLGTMLVDGHKKVAVAKEIAEAYRAVVDQETTIEPIIVDVPEGETPKIDSAIEEMPRVEIIDGLQVGFRQLDETTTSEVNKERAYLVLWRRDAQLHGFFYRTKRKVDLDELVKRAPRLLAVSTGRAAPALPKE